MEDQIEWYDRKSVRNQVLYKRIKIVELVAVFAIPFLSALNIAAGSLISHEISWIIAGLGILIGILEGLLAQNQYQQDWITYRSTCEVLKREKYAYLGKSGPYRDAADPRVLLSERMESLISPEHAKWSSITAARLPS